MFDGMGRGEKVNINSVATLLRLRTFTAVQLPCATRRYVTCGYVTAGYVIACSSYPSLRHGWLRHSRLRHSLSQLPFFQVCAPTENGAGLAIAQETLEHRLVTIVTKDDRD